MEFAEPGEPYEFIARGSKLSIWLNLERTRKPSRMVRFLERTMSPKGPRTLDEQSR